MGLSRLSPAHYSGALISWPAFTNAGTNYAATTLDMTTTPSVQYGTFTGAAPIAGLSAQPRYLIEGVKKILPGHGQAFFYRITIRAQGVNPNTVVWLQEVFTP